MDWMLKISAGRLGAEEQATIKKSAAANEKFLDTLLNFLLSFFISFILIS
jgi:hypothetical protein